MSRVCRIRPQQKVDDEGFTLTELLVVIVVIGILGTIAIPVFLNQRQKGYDAAAKSDLRNLSNFEEMYLNDMNGYGTIAQIQSVEPTLGASAGVTLSVVRYDGASGYCLSAKHSAGANTWYFDSEAGGLQPAGSPGCPSVTSGTAGDSITG